MKATILIGSFLVVFGSCSHAERPKLDTARWPDAPQRSNTISVRNSTPHAIEIDFPEIVVVRQGTRQTLSLYIPAGATRQFRGAVASHYQLWQMEQRIGDDAKFPIAHARCAPVQNTIDIGSPSCVVRAFR